MTRSEPTVFDELVKEAQSDLFSGFDDFLPEFRARAASQLIDPSEAVVDFRPPSTPRARLDALLTNLAENATGEPHMKMHPQALKWMVLEAKTPITLERILDWTFLDEEGAAKLLAEIEAERPR